MKLKLCEEQIDKIQQTINDNFYNWFGNSQLINSNGNPKIFYHGTNNDFRSFDNKKIGSNTDNGLRGRGFYFTNFLKSGQSYGSNILEVYLKMEKPLDLLSFNSLDEIIELLDIDPSIIHERGRGKPYPFHSISIITAYSGVFSDNVKEKGFDGIIHGQEHIVFYPNQIKAVNNDGSYDMNDNDIYS